MAFSQGYVFGFAAAVCVVCSLAIASVSLGLRDLQEANARRDKQANILMALGLNDGTLAGPAIDEVWQSKVEITAYTPAGELASEEVADLDDDGDVDADDLDLARERVKGTDQPPAIIGVFKNTDSGVVAIPVYGQGLWGPIAGYLALNAQATTVTGTTFFAPKETPGLGAEIMEPKFEQQWIGKKIVGPDGQTRPIDVVKGQAAVLCPNEIEHCVDGLSGATITARGVDVMVEEAFLLYQPIFQQLRGGA